MKTNELVYTVTYGSCCTAAWRCDDVTYEINTPKGMAEDQFFKKLLFLNPHAPYRFTPFYAPVAQKIADEC